MALIQIKQDLLFVLSGEMDIIERLMADLNTHPSNQQFSVTRTEGPDMRTLEAEALRQRLIEAPREVQAGLLIAVGIAAIHLAFFTLDEDELVEAADQAQAFLLEQFVVTWPECPRHADPLWPAVDSSVAVWGCRRDRNVRCKIGSLVSFGDR